MKKQFIKLTETDDGIIIINPSHILWINPDKQGSSIAINAKGKNDYPHFIYVKENFQEILSKVED